MIKRMLPLAILALGLFLVNATSGTADFEYIGAAKCKMCHNKPPKGEQFNQWSKTPHANAMKSLKGDEAKDPKCLKCHATAGHVKPELIQTLTVAEGVSCETCHGPGSVYKSNTIMKDRAKALANGMIIPDEKLCRTCHNQESPTFKGFDYKTALPKVMHPDPTLQ